jgi:(1->4)-alpha-D-glucan 1-alpha-D-glucosylmutase
MDDPNEEYLVWQTLIGAWPIVPGRLELYLQKALREGKRTTSWLDPDEAHERRVREFVRSLYSNHEFLEDFEPFAARVALAGEHASLGALLLRLTSPGVPDLYQGDTLWSLNLVDPDNRRPVDWAAHVSVLGERAPTRRTMKAHLIQRVLRLRSERPDAFAGDYEPLDLGPDRIGFVRGGAIRIVVPLRAGDRADAGLDRDILPEYDQELSIVG